MHSAAVEHVLGKQMTPDSIPSLSTEKVFSWKPIGAGTPMLKVPASGSNSKILKVDGDVKVFTGELADGTEPNRSDPV